MLGAFILGALGAAAAPYAEARIKGLVEDALMAETPMSPAELRSMALVICLVIAALAAWILTSGGALALTLGALLGVFGPRILAPIQNR